MSMLDCPLKFSNEMLPIQIGSTFRLCLLILFLITTEKICMHVGMWYGLLRMGNSH